MPRSEGVTLLETLIALLVSMTLLLAFFSLFQTVQTLEGNLSLLLERDENFWLAPLLLTRWFTAAGNNRWRQTWEGLSIQSGEVQINSDMDGAQGFPDGVLLSSFETVTLRHKASDLQLKSGSSTFQPLLKNISNFQVDGQALPVASVRIAAVTDRPLVAPHQTVSDSTALLVYIWNYRPNLFAESP